MGYALTTACGSAKWKTSAKTWSMALRPCSSWLSFPSPTKGGWEVWSWSRAMCFMRSSWVDWWSASAAPPPSGSNPMPNCGRWCGKLWSPVACWLWWSLWPAGTSPSRSSIWTSFWICSRTSLDAWFRPPSSAVPWSANPLRSSRWALSVFPGLTTYGAQP